MSITALGVRSRTGAPARPRPGPATLALARAEAVLLLRHPLVPVGVLVLAAVWWTGDPPRYPVLHYAVVTVQGQSLVLAAAVLVAANLAALRAHRRGVRAVLGVLPLAGWRRTAGHLLAVLPVAGVALLCAAVRTVTLAAAPGAVGRVDPWELLTVPVVVALAGAAGVLLAGLVPHPVAAPLAVTAALGWWLGLGSPRSSGSGRRDPLLPVMGENPYDLLPADLLGRPAGMHVAYVVALTLALGALALWRSGAPRVPAAAAAGVAVAVAATVGAVHAGPPSAGLLARRAAAADAPAAAQTCERRGTVTYCAYAGFPSMADAWVPVVEAVRRRVPPAAAARPFAVRQRITLTAAERGVGDDTSVRVGDRTAGWRADDARAGTPVTVPVGTAAGDPADGLSLATHTAHLLVTGATPGGAWNPVCGGVGVLTAWLAGQAVPGGADRLADGMRWQQRMVLMSQVTAGPELVVGGREAVVATALLRRPPDGVAAAVTRSWGVLTDRATTVERAAAVLGVTAPAPFAPLPEGERFASGECG